MASSGLFFPTTLITISASLSAAPVFSRTEPINAPSMITIPMLLNVPEKPAPITVGIPETFVPSALTVSTNGIPANIARIIDTTIIAKKGCTLNLEIATIITMIAITNAIINAIPDIKTPHFH